MSNQPAILQADGYVLLQEQDVENFGGDMQVVFRDGFQYSHESFYDIRDRFNGVVKEEE